GALADVLAFLPGTPMQALIVSGDHVAPREDGGNPEGVDDVARGQTDLQVRVDRPVEDRSGLLGFLSAVELDLFAGVVDVLGLTVAVPRPLFGCDLDALPTGGLLIGRLRRDPAVLEEAS